MNTEINYPVNLRKVVLFAQALGRQYSPVSCEAAVVEASDCAGAALDAFWPPLTAEAAAATAAAAAPEVYCGVAHSRSFRMWMMVLMSRLGLPWRSCRAGLRVPVQREKRKHVEGRTANIGKLD